MPVQVHRWSAFLGLHPTLSPFTTPSRLYSPKCPRPRRRRCPCRQWRGEGARRPPPSLPPARPRAPAYPLRPPAGRVRPRDCEPWGPDWGRREGRRGVPVCRGRWTPAPTFNSVCRLPTAPPPPPLSASWEGWGRGGQTGAGRETTAAAESEAQALVWVFDFPALGAPGANQLGARAHSLRGRGSFSY